MFYPCSQTIKPGCREAVGWSERWTAMSRLIEIRQVQRILVARGHSTSVATVIAEPASSFALRRPTQSAIPRVHYGIAD